MIRLTSALLVLFSVANAMVVFDHSLLMDFGDLLSSMKADFECPNGCRVYSPTTELGIAIMDHSGKEYYTLDQLAKALPGHPFSLPPNKYYLQYKTWEEPEFTFYVVQNGAPNYDVPVYTTMGKNSVTDQRYLTFLSDGPGISIYSISGVRINDNVTVYATGADSMDNKACRPVFASRSFDNAVRSFVGIRGPIATIDFGSSKNKHSATFSPNYEMYTAELGSSSVDASPGYVGCGSSTIYRDSSLNKVHKNLFATQKQDFCFILDGGYVLMDGANTLTGNSSDVVFLVNHEKITLSGNGTINRSFSGSSFNVEILWDKQGETDSSQFAFQLDLLPQGNC